ncbi:HTH-type transcriptional regulator BetI [Mycobacterium marinum]|uniref:Transcriptional regulator n=1 Tax=Mycobacterium marinum (strain ATCC BAA-535 / M) TaxID=216594 RepID=B2HH55_MYCMM|nr:TetR/AcrR family transcriptional regulator [Mycobacterium marinum]ACC43310.1 transcriptional regulator [Mycobacterium marinum M]MDC8973105.1 TetR/AcrR family transcriptional regulator [Mycobacterium marinum]QQW32978.1 TetR/AcrR family transcriptional regulator [Mycobacterium marinum]RFZ41622.1 HTH-type transcriptional regulator BetI [Mycobacterium marinum]RFZ54255.1 HTH-type transcriptional regulator BetI [Mycobacterium marinum]
MNRPAYHHGDLRAVILDEAARLVAQRGADRVSMRELARDAGVSHAAPAHHFTDRRGLFTALATQGFQLLAAALVAARGHFADAALAYVRFAIEHPGHYQVMFNRSLHDADDADLAAAQAAAAAELAAGVATLRDPGARSDPEGAQLAAWSLVHGFSTLWLNDALDAQVRALDPMDTVLRIAMMLFKS